MKNKVPMINIIIIALFNYVFLGTEYMYDNMMLYVINSNGVVNAQNYILGVSVAGFLMYPLLKRVYRKNNNMLLLHIFKVCVVITGIICIAVMGTHSSYVSIFISGCVFFAIMGIVGSAVHYSLAVNISNYSMPVSYAIGIAYALGVLIQIDSYECIPEGIEIMGAVIVNIFYITSDDNSPMGSINSVIPFTTVVELKEYNKNLIEYTIRPSIEQLQASMNSSAQIEVKAVIALDTICFEPFNINVIDECECNKRENVDYSALPSMVGYISDGKCTVWDIAKKYDTTGDLMREENSTIQRLVDSDIIPAGTKLLLVRKAMV